MKGRTGRGEGEQKYNCLLLLLLLLLVFLSVLMRSVTSLTFILGLKLVSSLGPNKLCLQSLLDPLSSWCFHKQCSNENIENN